MSIYQSTLNCNTAFVNYSAAELHKGENSPFQKLQGRFDVWRDYSGATARDGVRLDNRLSDFPQVVEVIVELLEIVSQGLDDARVTRTTQSTSAYKDVALKSTASTSHENTDVSGQQKPWDDILSAVNELMKLTTMIRKSSSSNPRYQNAYPAPEGEDARFELYCPILVRREFPDARTSLTKLLSDAVIQRRRRLIRQRRRQLEQSAPEEVTHQINGMSLLPHHEDIQGGGVTAMPDLGRHQPQKDSSASVVSKPGPSIRHRFRSTVQPAESIIGTSRSAAEPALYPPLPKPDSKNPDSAICPYCSEPLTLPLLAEAWKNHIDKDLQIYVCLSETCAANLKFFDSSTNWNDHMAVHHRPDWPQKIHLGVWYCNLDHPKEAVFTNVEGFRAHYETEHPEIYGSDRQMKTHIRRDRKPGQRDEHFCPLCETKYDGRSTFLSRFGLLEHIREHLRYLAMFSLPFVDSDDRSDVTSDSGPALPSIFNDDDASGRNNSPAASFSSSVHDISPLEPESELPMSPDSTITEFLRERLEEKMGPVMDEDDPVLSHLRMSRINNPQNNAPSIGQSQPARTSERYSGDDASEDNNKVIADFEPSERNVISNEDNDWYVGIVEDPDQAGLHNAAAKGDLYMLHRLLSHNTDADLLNSKDQEGWTALQRAAFAGHGVAVQLLIEKGADVNAKGGEYDNALQAAAAQGHANVVQTLLHHSASIHPLGGHYRTALQAAAWNGYPEVVRILLNAEPHHDGDTIPYQDAIEDASMQGHSEIVRMLQEAQKKQGTTLSHRAESSNSVDAAQESDQDEDLKARGTPSTTQGQSGDLVPGSGRSGRGPPVNNEKLLDTLFPRSAQVPWLNSPSIGDFIYRPETDEIVLKKGHHYARPQQIQAHSLRAASYSGPLPTFEYTGTPPGDDAANLTFGNNRTETFTPLATPEPEQPFGEVRLYPTRTVSRTGPSQSIRSQDDKRVVFSKPTGSQRQQGLQAASPGKGAPGIPINNENLLNTLFPRYKPRVEDFFSVNRTFLILCHEPTEGASTVTSWERGIDLSRIEGRPFTRVRRLLIIDSGPPGSSFCRALPISTYGGRGVARPGVIRSDHCIIFSGEVAPQPTQAELPRRGEAGMQPTPIRVIMNDPTDRLDPMSRMNLASPVLINHNERIRDIGVLGGQSAHDLRYQFRNVWGNRPMPSAPGPSGPPRPRQAPSHEEESDDDAYGDGDDDEDDTVED